MHQPTKPSIRQLYVNLATRLGKVAWLPAETPMRDDAVLIHTRLGDQPAAAYLAINFHAKAHAIVGTPVFGSGKSALPALGKTACGDLPSTKRLLETIDARPAARRLLAPKQRHDLNVARDDQAAQAMSCHLSGRKA